MTREARIVEAPGVRIVVSGGRAQLLSDLLEAAHIQGAAGIVSFGLCGGLDPSLRLGDIIIESSHPDWRRGLVALLPGARSGTVAGADTMVTTPAEKARLYLRIGAEAVDMETHVVRDYADRKGLPYAVLRAVSDTAERALPRAALAGLKANGDEDIFGVLRELAFRPWELPALLRTAREANVAFASLGNARDLLGPGLGCPDFIQHLVDVG